MQRLLVSVAIAKEAEERTYYATLGPARIYRSGGGRGGLDHSLKRRGKRTHLSHIAVVSQDQSTAAHIHGCDPVAAHSCAPVSSLCPCSLPRPGRKVTTLCRSEINKRKATRMRTYLGSLWDRIIGI